MRKRNLLKFLLICSILTTISNFPPGFTNSSVNTAVDKLKQFNKDSYEKRNWYLTDSEESVVRAATLNCWYIGQVFGAMMTPFFTDGLGRKAAYIYATICMIIASIVQYLATIVFSPELLIAGRSLSALFSPLSDAALILYLQECSPANFRGMFSFYGEIGYCSMCLLGMILGMKNVLGNSLPHLFGYAIIPGFFFMVFLLFIPETPKYLMIIRKDRKAALESLEFFQGIKKNNEQILDGFLRESELEEYQEKTSVMEILTTWHLRHAVILASIVLVLNLPFYPILQSSTHFLTSPHLKFSYEFAQSSSTGLMLAFLVSCIIGSFFIDRVSRRFLIIFFGILSNLFLGLFAVLCSTSSFDWWIKYAALGSLICYCITYGMVLGPISWFVAPELVAQRHRSTVFCICYGINNMLIACTNFGILHLFDAYGGYAMIPMFILPAIFCLIYLYYYLPETLGKETHEIILDMCRRDPIERNKLKDVLS